MGQVRADQALPCSPARALLARRFGRLYARWRTWRHGDWPW